MKEALIDGTELARTLARVASERNLPFSDIDELCDVADEHGLWSEELYDRATRLYKKTLIRSIIRKPHEGEDGRTIEWVNVLQVDPDTGHKRPVYKQLKLFDADDTEYVVRDRWSRAGKFIQEARRFRDIGIERFGKRFQKRIDFDIDGIDGIDIPES